MDRKKYTFDVTMTVSLSRKDGKDLSPSDMDALEMVKTSLRTVAQDPERCQNAEYVMVEHHVAELRRSRSDKIEEIRAELYGKLNSHASDLTAGQARLLLAEIDRLREGK